MAIADDGRNNVSFVAEAGGSDKVIKNPGANGRVVLRGFQFSSATAGTFKVHFATSEGDVRWSQVATVNVPIGLGRGRVELVGPVGASAYVSKSGGGTFDGWADYEVRRAPAS